LRAVAEARSFLKHVVLAAAGVAALLFFAILLLDPYGNSPLRLVSRQPIMDINQRYMYPRIARSKA
jgi:hypothetical protein